MTDVVFENVFPFPLGEARLALETRLPGRHWGIVQGSETLPGNPHHFPATAIVSGTGEGGPVGARIAAKIGRLAGETPPHGWSLSITADAGTPPALAAQVELALANAFAQAHGEATFVRPRGSAEWLDGEAARRAQLMAEQGNDHHGLPLPDAAPAAPEPVRTLRPRRGPSSLTAMRMPPRRPPADLTGLLKGLNMGEG